MADPNRDPVSETELCNRALSRLGCREISSVLDGTPEANAARRHYFDVRDELLESYTWDFAISTAQVAADSSAPAFGYSNAYTLPGDYLRLFKIYLQSDQYAIQGGKILSNYSAPLDIYYVAQITDPTRFSPLFMKALTLQLAAAMCELLTQSTSKKKELLEEFEAAIAEARRIKSIQQPPVDAPTDPWLRSRDAGTGGAPITPADSDGWWWN